MELSGNCELGHWTPIDGYYVKLEQLTKARHFHILVTDRPKTNRVRARRHPKRVDGKREANA